MKAWQLSLVGCPEHIELVRADTAAKARYNSDLRADGELWTTITVHRVPELDGDGPVTYQHMIAAGWGVPCLCGAVIEATSLGGYDADGSPWCPKCYPAHSR